MAPALTDVAEGARNLFARDSSLKHDDYKPAASSVLKLQVPSWSFGVMKKLKLAVTYAEVVQVWARRWFFSVFKGLGMLGRRQESSLNKATTAGLIFRQTELVVIRRSLRDRYQFVPLLITPI